MEYDDDFHQTRKERKQWRKLVEKSDRSKFKKTDRKKREESLREETAHKLSKRDLIEGRVLAIGPEGISVESHQKVYLCLLSGLLKKEVSRADNLVAVGDFVLFDARGLLFDVLPRRSALSRQKPLKGHKEQCLVANVDQVLITVSVGVPTLKTQLVDRYIIAARKGKMEPVIVINKVDLLDLYPPHERVLFEAFLTIYPSLGVPVVPVSAVSKEGIAQLEELMRDKSSVFSGQSGVGKSSLIHEVTGLDLPVGNLAKTQKGSHTTTTTRLIPLPKGGWCVDTPGIRTFSLVDLTRSDVEEYFSEIKELSHKCKYANCVHSHEPHCAVYAAMLEGRLHPLRLHSYLKLMGDL